LTPLLPPDFNFSFSILLLLGRTMAQVISIRPLTAEAQVRARVIPSENLWRTKWHWEGFSPSSSVLPVSIIPL
jgi:hypothetical protein